MYSLKSLKQVVLPTARRLAARNISSISSSYRSSFRQFNPQKTAHSSSLLKQFRSYSVLSSSPEAQLYKYEDIKKIVQNPSEYPEKVLIDVREPVEYNDGHIDGAINIPFKSSPGALDLPEDEFIENFGFQKPSIDKELVFYCLGGVRSTAAEELANTFGYKKRGNYVGSWEDWAARENK